MEWEHQKKLAKKHFHIFCAFDIPFSLTVSHFCWFVSVLKIFHKICILSSFRGANYRHHNLTRVLKFITTFDITAHYWAYLDLNSTVIFWSETTLEVVFTGLSRGR